MVLGVLLFLLAMTAFLLITAPLSKSLQPITSPSITLLSAEGRPIARKGAVVAAPVKAAELPAHIPAAFLAIEDRRFYDHPGIDAWGIARAAFVNATSGEVAEGGSTITQQLAKLAFLSSEQTAARKAQELVLALWLEAWLDKEEILSRYMSSVYFGDNVYGLRAAANHYFSRKPEELTVKEAAMLAGLVKAPSRLAPTSNLKGARERGDLVLNAMVEAGFVDATAAAKAPEVVINKGAVKNLPKGTYFADWVLDELDAREASYGQRQIRTTLEDRLQRQAVNAIRSVGTGDAQVALVSMRSDGRVVAMVGGKNYRQSAFNRATQAKRQPGSTFKLFVYLAALRAGYSPQDMIQDQPLRVGNWTPKNYEGKYRGPITLREAFAVSSNVGAVRLSESVGRSAVIQAARDLGVTAELENTPSLALGTSGVPLIEMVSAFAAVRSGSYPIKATGIPERAQSGTSPLKDNERQMLGQLLFAAGNEGTGRAAAIPAGTFGKTGTTQDSRDAYFIGFAGDLATGVWIGHDDNRSLGDTVGGGVPAQIWGAYMVEATKGAPPIKFTPPQPQAQTPAYTLDRTDYYVQDYDVEFKPPAAGDGGAGQIYVPPPQNTPPSDDTGLLIPEPSLSRVSPPVPSGRQQPAPTERETPDEPAPPPAPAPAPRAPDEEPNSE